jgi:hypothetical protein
MNPLPLHCQAITTFLLACSIQSGLTQETTAEKHSKKGHAHHEKISFSIRSIKSGNWSDRQSWNLDRVPTDGDRVLISQGTHINYDVQSLSVIRLVQIVGTLEFSRQRNTELNVGLITIEHREECSEDGFACEFEGGTSKPSTPDSQWPTLIVGTINDPIPAQYTAKISLHYLKGMNPKNAPAIACCSGRMDIHGAPLGSTWSKLAMDAAAGVQQISVAGPIDDWKAGDQIIVTASERPSSFGSFRVGSRGYSAPQTETREITQVQGQVLFLDKPLNHRHSGSGLFRSEVANLSRNVVIQTADPSGIRGHTVYHAHSRGSIGYTRFFGLGKEGILGRYPVHFHLVGDTMRGSSVIGASIVDSHNRWVTIHGTNYLLVRDCIGFQSVGHGFFMEDGTEVDNVVDRNLGVQAYAGKPLPNQVLTFDQNEGAAFWWGNGRNTFSRNVGVESDQYGFRYDMQMTSRFDCRLPIRQPDGSTKLVDVRTIPIWRFEQNEAHGSFAGMVVAANGIRQPDNSITSKEMLDRIKRVDWTGPDTRHPHFIRNFLIWQSHYAFRPQSPAMLMENITIDRAAYGIYRPAFENHQYKNLRISRVAAEPFNRGMDDASAQTGKISVDGLEFSTGYGNQRTPLVQLSDHNLSGDAETHFRNVTVLRPEKFKDRWPLINRGVGPRVPAMTAGVPIYIHDYYGQGRHAKIISSAAKDLLDDGHLYTEQPPLTGDESRVAEIKNVAWPTLLKPIDDLPPATMITGIARLKKKLRISGVSHDNGDVLEITVNKSRAKILSQKAGIVDWEIDVALTTSGEIQARAIDNAGNREITGHRIDLQHLQAVTTISAQ